MLVNTQIAFMRIVSFSILVLVLVLAPFVVAVRVEAQESPPVLAAEAITLTLYPIRGELAVQVTAPESTAAKTEVVLQKAGASETLVAGEASLDASRTASCTLNISGLQAGAYEAKVTLLDAAGTPIFLGSQGFEIPERPAWLGSREGLCDGLPPGWAPIQAEGNAVRPWGREYRFDGLPGPVAVTAAGSAVLTGPVRFVARAGGAPLVWTPAETRVEKVNDGIIKATTGAESEVCRLSASITVEFDGMIRSDWQLLPKGSVTLEYLGIELPFAAKHARYLYSYPGSWGNAYNAGAAPGEPKDMEFRPFIWLGDEERGFCWFSESDRNFSVAEPNQVTQIVPGPEETLLRVNMITTPTVLDAPLDYTFGFQATPVRDNPEDVWDFRICHHGNYGIEDKPYNLNSNVVYPAKGSINPVEGTVEAWVRVAFDPDIEIQDVETRGELNRKLFTLSAKGSTDEFGFYWNIDDRGMRAYLKQGDRYPAMVSTQATWKQGEWHHVAVTWGAGTMEVWNDGRKVGETPWNGVLTPAPDVAEMLFQCLPGHFDIDEIRVSDIARTSFDVAKAPEADDHTLLLDHFEGLNPLLVHTRPETGPAGTVFGAVAASGPHGVCLASSASDKPVTLLDRLEELGVRTICFHEHWTDIQNYATTTHGAELTKLVRACHAHNIRLIPYFGYELSNIAPEWRYYSEECLVAPRAGGYHRQPEQNAYIVCYRSAWQDYMADGIARTMDEYDLDGVYLDGMANPWKCRNTKHGCGYVKPDGTIGDTYPIFATREMMKRIWTLVKSRKPDGMINVHQSTTMTIPTVAFATSYWDGEQLGGIPRGQWSLDLLPLDAFRCEFMGHPWGVPAELLCYEQPYSYAEAMSFSLLHDVLVRGQLGGNLEMESKLWHAMDAFGRKQATWLPYWKNQEVVTTDSNDTKVSLYSRGAEGLVAVVSNLGKEPREVTARLNLEALKLSGTLSAYDILNEEESDFPADGVIVRLLNPLEFRILWIRPSGMQ